jgi:hypothetical protein
MKTKMPVVVMLVLLAPFLGGCGKPVPQNRVALVVRTLGERSTSNAAASAEIYWARRLPFSAGANPGIRIFTFPLGLQDYSFTEKPSYESPRDEAIETDCLGGHLKFDVNIQLYIDKRLPDRELENRLLSFINDHQLQNYNGEQDMLARWAGEKLRQFIREPLAQYTLNKQAIDVMRSKGEMNKVLLKRMNERFGKYGLVFCAAGITSPVGLPTDQKDRMNKIVQQEYANRALELREKQYMPLATDINNIEQDGLKQCQREKNRGITESIRILADAQRERRQTFIALVGEENYVILEQMLTMVKGLGSGRTKVMVIPKSLTYANIVTGAEQEPPEQKIPAATK